MPARAQLVRWGNSLAVRIPESVAEEAALSEGDDLLLRVEGRKSLALKAVDCAPSLDELLARITADNLHGEADWGDSVGNEKW
jgi:antitoxin MazE